MQRQFQMGILRAVISLLLLLPTTRYGAVAWHSPPRDVVRRTDGLRSPPPPCRRCLDPLQSSKWTVQCRPTAFVRTTATCMNIKNTPTTSTSVGCAVDDDDDSRQHVLLSRKQWWTECGKGMIVFSILAGFEPKAAVASSSTTNDSIDDDDDRIKLIRTAFDAVRYEATADDGGIMYMQGRIEQSDFAALLEFTKTYDQVLRKGVMGRAKKFLETSEQKEVATTISNAVTFDLIGINRSSRPGQESIENATKYLQELQKDIQKFLTLEPQL